MLDLEDELFDVEGSDTGVGLGLSGPQVLLATLERSRTGRMRDIVATVQREQDEIIRGPLPGILVVQGGPGTGKTAVALHRAAYLLYTYRFPLEGQGVLVVGPNPTFLRYIEHVLPSLDESGVELSTVNGLFSGGRGRSVGRTKTSPGSRVTPAWPACPGPGRGRPANVRCVAPSRSRSGPGSCASLRRSRLRSSRPASAGRAPTTSAGGPSRPCSGGRSLEQVAAERATDPAIRMRPARPPSAEDLGRAAAPAAGGGRRPRAHVAAADPATAAARSVRCRPADRAGRRQDPRPGGAPALAASPARPTSARCDGPTPTCALLDEARALLGPPRRRPCSRRRRRSPDLRSRGRRRSPGPVADAAADGRPAIAVGFDDGRRRHRPGDRDLGAGVLVPGGRAPPGPPGLAAGRVDGQLPHAERDRGGGRPDPRAGGAGHAAPRSGPHQRPAAPDHPGRRCRPGRCPAMRSAKWRPSAVRDELDGLRPGGTAPARWR